MDQKSFIRVIIALVALVNTVLTALGHQVIDASTVNEITILAGAAWVGWTMYKNNYLFGKGKHQKEVLEKENLK